jgi:flagellar assembly factor FliW
MKTLELAEKQPTPAGMQGVIQLPFGLLGFERVKNYMLLAKPGEEPFMWLQMVGESNQAFLVISPALVMPDYRPDIPDIDAEFLGLESSEDAIVFTIVTLGGQKQATVNLQGPIVINRHSLIGKQVIPNNAANYDLRHPLPVS